MTMSLRRGFFGLLACALACIICLSGCLRAGMNTSGANPVPAPGPFDGAYVPDTARNSGAGLLTVSPCLPSETAAFGQGLIVKNSVATFELGVQPIGALKVKPDKVVGPVSSDGKLDISRKMLHVTGEFEGPAVSGRDNHFTGQLIIIVNEQKSCGYSLYLTRVAAVKPA